MAAFLLYWPELADMKQKTFLVFFTLVQLLQVSAQQKDSLAYRNLEPYDFHLLWLREEKALLIDVREPFEFRRNRIHDALNIPSQAQLTALTDTLSKDFTLLLYCSTGYRSKKAAELAAAKGFGKAVSLDGGIVAWKKEDFPVERKKLKKN
jgi:rhodanese-related sulfurtransferase